MDGSPNPEFIRENDLKEILHPVVFLDALFPIYKQKKGGRQNKCYFLSTEYFLKWSNEKSIDMGIGDTLYPNFLPFKMDEFDRHLYIHYFNDLKPSPRIQMKFNSSSADPVQGNNFLSKIFFHIAVWLHKEFKCCFACQDPWNPIPARNLYLDLKLYSFLKNILYVFRFAWFLGRDLYFDYQTIGFKGRHVDKTIISYNN